MPQQKTLPRNHVMISFESVFAVDKVTHQLLEACTEPLSRGTAPPASDVQPYPAETSVPAPHEYYDTGRK